MRPAVVIQNNLGNEHGSTTIVAAVSTKYKDLYPFQVFISAKDSGLDRDSIIDLQQIMTVDKTRLLKKIGRIKDDTIQQMDKAIKISLSL